MNILGVKKTDYFSFGNRLLKEDITRLPSKDKNKPDFYVASDTKVPQKSNFWRNTFTAATFGLTGLYIAHRNNLFNPVKREAKKVIKTQEMIQKTREFVAEIICSDVNRKNAYSEAAKKVLSDFANDNARGKEMTDEARRILTDENSLINLMKEVTSRLNDVKDSKGAVDFISLKDGYTVDVLDKLLIFIEKHLKGIKNNGQEYKNQSVNVMDAIFNRVEDGTTVAQKTLQEIIGNRSSGVIDNFIRDSVLNRKFSV